VLPSLATGGAGDGVVDGLGTGVVAAGGGVMVPGGEGLLVAGPPSGLLGTGLSLEGSVAGGVVGAARGGDAAGGGDGASPLGGVSLLLLLVVPGWVSPGGVVTGLSMEICNCCRSRRCSGLPKPSCPCR
jgi:hypothetical protein